MHSVPWSSPLGRVILGVGVFTLSFWALAAAAFLTWSPGRGLAASAAARFTPEGTQAAPAVADEQAADDPCSSACDEDSGSSYSMDTDGDGFSWAVVDSDGSVSMDNGSVDRARAGGRRGQPVFWFRDADQEFWVDDRAILEEVRQATRPLREIGREMGKVGGEQSEHARSQHELSRCMSELSARNQEALRDARAKVREISRRARREGKAERPHANA